MRRLLALLLALALLAPAAAHANGDPASDVLLSQDSYLPYAPPIRDDLKTALEDTLKAARAAGYPMKVALIQTPNDLGAFPDLFNQPQAYADMLLRGLSSLNPHGDPLKDVHLLTVMPGGFGGNNLGDRVDDALQPISINTEAQSDGLAQAAIRAVAALATINGHEVPEPPEATVQLAATNKSTKRKSTNPLVFIAPAALLFGGLFVATQISKRRTARDDNSVSDA